MSEGGKEIMVFVQGGKQIANVCLEGVSRKVRRGFIKTVRVVKSSNKCPWG